MYKPDLLIDRNKLTKKLLKWKLAFLVISLLLIAALLAPKYTNIEQINPNKNYVGVIKLENEIIEDQKYDKMLDEIEKNASLKALIVNINSPGGSTGASEKIYRKLKRIGTKIPVVATITTLGASGGYLVALSAEKIYALNMSITGSIGVIMQSPNIIELGEKLGIKFKNYKSSPLKASPNPLEPTTKEAEEVIMSVIDDTHDYFVGLLLENRKISPAEAKKLADGRIYNGRQALKLKLIDEIGTTEDAFEWLKKEKKLPQDVKLKLIEPKKHIEIIDYLLNNIDNYAKNFFAKFKTKFVAEL